MASSLLILIRRLLQLADIGFKVPVLVVVAGTATVAAGVAHLDLAIDAAV